MMVAIINKQKLYIQDFHKTYTMTTLIDRNTIIQKINNSELTSETKTGKKHEWWLRKHNPNSIIPKNIYYLGEGNINKLYEKYINKYGVILWEEFINYTRELIKQKIMI